MEDNNAMGEMLQRVKAHEQSTIMVIESKSFIRRKEGGPSVVAALADEETTRKELISWQAPNAPLAVRKLLHLLAHVLAAELAFDDQSLAGIVAESNRLGSDGCASSPDHPMSQSS